MKEPVTAQQIIEICRGNFYKDFAGKYSGYILSNQAVDTLYAVQKEFIIHPSAFGITHRPTHAKIGFRTVFILEHIYLKKPDALASYYKDIFTLFSRIVNPSVMRSYGKIAADILAKQKYTPAKQVCKAIAETCLQWTIDEKTRCAVKINAIEILFLLKEKVDFIPELLPDIIERSGINPSPAMIVRLRKWQNRL